MSTPKGVEQNSKVTEMREFSNREKEFEKSHTVRGHFQRSVKLGCVYSSLQALSTLLGLPLIIVAVWALIRCAVFLPITYQASSSVITISVLLMVVGALVITVGIGFVFALTCEKASTNWENLRYHSILNMPIAATFLLALISIALGIAAATLSPKVSEMIQTDANSSFFSNEGTRSAWNAAQNMLRCCGVQSFRDYEEVFNNSSIPVSCCNTDNSFGESLCTDMDVDSITNTTELIHTEGCISQLESYFRYTFSVIAGVSITAGILQLCGGSVVLYWIILNLKMSRELADEIDDNDDNDIYDCCISMNCCVGLVLSGGPIIFTTVGIWALVRVLLPYYSITVPASSSVIVISAMLIVASMFMLIGSSTAIFCGCQILIIEKYNDRDLNMLLLVVSFGLWIMSFFIVIGAGIAAAVLTSDLSEAITSSTSSTLTIRYLTDQNIQDTWNSVQEALTCCGAFNFTDYQLVFNNMSVPVSCCNFTNPLVNMTTCQEIVSNANLANQTGLIYSEGCVSCLESLFHYTFSVIAGVTITVAVLQIAVITACGVVCGYWAWLFAGEE